MTCGRHQQGKAIDFEIAQQIAPKEVQPPLLRKISELFALLRTGKLQPAKILQW